MVFYFSGTGNSKYAAKAIAEENETLIDIGECFRNDSLQFEIPDGERMGFCFPIYYGGIPRIIQDFFDKWTLTGTPGFVFGVLTCGSTPFASSEIFEERLKEHNIELDSVYAVKMPDNCVIVFELQAERDQRIVLESAERRLAEIKEELREEKKMMVKVDDRDRRSSKTMYLFYKKKGKKTKKFYTDSNCTGCGLCVERCPEKAIELVNGKPTWIKDHCSMCMSCMRCNAVQYGGHTSNRTRYTHPMLKKEEKKTNCC